jgi:hypothetical protein
MAAGPCDTACGVEACLLSTTAPLLNCFWQSLRRAAAKVSALRNGGRGHPLCCRGFAHAQSLWRALRGWR